MVSKDKVQSQYERLQHERLLLNQQLTDLQKNIAEVEQRIYTIDGGLEALVWVLTDEEGTPDGV